MNFTTESGRLVLIPVDDIQALSFIDQDVFVMYTAGDCDVFLSFNPLTH